MNIAAYEHFSHIKAKRTKVDLAIKVKVNMRSSIDCTDNNGLESSMVHFQVSMSLA